MHVDEIALGDAGVVALTITADGVLLGDLQVAPSWVVLARQPTPGFLRRARPGPFARVLLRQGDGLLVPELEFEVGRMDDGTWELAVNEQWYGDAGTVPTPAGDVVCRVVDGLLELIAAEARDGWSVRAQVHDGEEVVAVFTRGSGVWTEEWEVVVLTDIDGSGSWVIERERRWRIPPVG